MAFQIFIVEDHPVMRNTYAALFRREPDLVVTGMAASGEEALRLLVSSQADLVLIDLSLPDMTGPTLIAHLYQTLPTLPILIVSGQESSIYTSGPFPAYSSNVKGFVQKWDIPQLLVPTIRQVLAI